jgi:hypothetical protein
LGFGNAVASTLVLLLLGMLILLPNEPPPTAHAQNTGRVFVSQPPAAYRLVNKIKNDKNVTKKAIEKRKDYECFLETFLVLHLACDVVPLQGCSCLNPKP